MRIISWAHMVFLFFSNHFSKRVGVDLDLTNEVEIVLSLTTYPARFDAVCLTIESLLNQTLKPSRLILWLSKDELSEARVPKKISKLRPRGLDIRLVDGNIRSYKKLIYTLKEFDNSIIVTVDDDTIYPKTFLERLYRKWKAYPECVVAYRCSEIVKITSKQLAPYLDWPPANSSLPSYNLFPTGVGGILYPPGCLHEKVYDEDLFLDLAPYADDIWFKAMALMAGTKTVMVNEISIEFLTIPGTQRKALWHKNNGDKKNDKQLEKVFKYFDLYSKIG